MSYHEGSKWQEQQEDKKRESELAGKEKTPKKVFENYSPSPYADACKQVFGNLRTSDQLFKAWQANIAMAFKDECENQGIKFPQLHEVANNAAKNFLNLLIK